MEQAILKSLVEFSADQAKVVQTEELFRELADAELICVGGGAGEVILG
jgi:hypothetical protein